MTRSHDEEDRIRCELHNVDAYITKPVDLDRFLKLVRDLKRYWHKDVILPNQPNHRVERFTHFIHGA